MTPGRNATPPASEIVQFAAAHEFEAWLEINHERHDEIWLKIAKKGAPQRSITYADAVDLALCYGWIDGQKAASDQHHWLQRFTRRTRQSRWSQINREKAERLLAEGRVRAAGHAEIQRAQTDGRWDSAYAGQGGATVPEDLQRELDNDPEAAAAFSQLDRQNRYSIIWRINDAKRPETRARRVAKYLDMIRRGEPIHERSSARGSS
jgi:uncharacterized protein YdeI (YjbR/CyaY-like superfamily)